MLPPMIHWVNAELFYNSCLFAPVPAPIPRLDWACHVELDVRHCGRFPGDLGVTADWHHGRTKQEERTIRIWHGITPTL